MSGAIYLAASGAMIQQMRLEVLANNMANVDSVGFKEDQLVFSLMEAKQQPPENNLETPGISQEISPYTPPFEQVTDFSSGPLMHTGNTLDFAINGDGFFSVRTGNGIEYTRKGNFILREDGVLTTMDGFPVLSDSGEIVLDGNEITVDGDGNIYVDGDGAGTFAIVDFPKKGALRKTGNNRFMNTDPDTIGTKPGKSTINQGYVEKSNVNAIRAMTDMIETLRVFETYKKVIQSADDATSKSINEVGRPVA